VLVLHLFLLRVDNIQFSLLRCRLFLFACGLSDSHSFCLFLSFSCNKNTLAVEQASERAAISHPSAINYLCRVLDTLAHQATLFASPLLCGAIFNNLNIAPLGSSAAKTLSPRKLAIF